MNENKEIKYIKPFKRLCMTIGQLPSSYLETMSYYEMLVWFIKFLSEQVIPVVNNNSEVVEELQNYVTNYFDNLDVQEEINNKLDEMAEDGVLDQIIEQYLNSSAFWGFDTVNDMKNATNLINGSFAKTLGYFEKNDFGGATYKIRTITNDDTVDDTTIISLNEPNLIAELIFTDELNSRQLGVYGDKIHDDTEKLQSALNLNKKITLIGEIKVTDNIDIDVAYHEGIKGLSGTKICGDFTSGNYPIFNLSNSLYSPPSGVYGTVDRFTIDSLYFTDITETNITDTTHYGYGIQLGDGCCNLTIKNCVFRNLVYGLYAPNSSHGVYLDKFQTCYFRNNDYGIYINTSSSNDNGENFQFINSTISTSKIGNLINNDMYVNFIGCSIDYNLGNSLIIKDSAVVSLTNCHIEWYASTPLIDIQYNASLTCNSCIFFRTTYDDGGTNNYMIYASIGEGVPEVIFNSCSFYMARTYTNLSNTIPYIEFNNCSRMEYTPTTYTTPYTTLNLTESINYLYPLNYDSGLTRNSTKVKVTCSTQKNGNSLCLPINYNNKDGKITLVVNSSIALSSVIDCGSALFNGDGVIYSTGVLSSTHSIPAGTDTTITIYHKFRKGDNTKPFIRIHLGELTQGATFEVKQLSVQLI